MFAFNPQEIETYMELVNSIEINNLLSKANDNQLIHIVMIKDNKLEITYF